MRAVIPAAGLGTRFLPVTKAVPKELLPLGGKPAIHWVVDEALGAGADGVVIVTSPRKRLIEEYFSPDEALAEELDSRGKPGYAELVRSATHPGISYVIQEEQLGLGHAVLCAEAAVGGEPLFVLLADVVVPGGGLLERMAEVSRQHGGASVVGAMRMPMDQVCRCGVIDGEDLGGGVWRVRCLVEKPRPEDAPSDLTVFGRYLLSPRVMELLHGIAPGVSDEVQLTDAIQAALAEEEVYAVEVSPDEGMDVGTPESWVECNTRFTRKGDSV